MGCKRHFTPPTDQLNDLFVQKTTVFDANRPKVEEVVLTSDNENYRSLPVRLAASNHNPL